MQGKFYDKQKEEMIRTLMYCTVLWNDLKFNKNQVWVTEHHQWTDQILTVDMDSTRSNGQHLFMSVDDDNDGE